MTKDEALKRIAAYPFSRAEELSVEQMREIAREALAHPEQDLTNLERHERNVQRLFGTPQPKEPEQEPVAWLIADGEDLWATNEKNMMLDYPKSQVTPLYTTPPQRTWVGLTDEEKQEWIDAMPWDPQPRHCMILMNVIEAKLREKNT